MSHDEFDFGIGDVSEVVYAPATVPEAGPGDGVTAPECLWPFQCPCLPCYYQLNPIDPAVDGRVAFTPDQGARDQGGHNMRQRIGSPKPPPPAF